MPRRPELGQEVSRAVKAWATEIERTAREHRWAPTDRAPITTTAIAQSHLLPPEGKYRSPYDGLCDGIATRLSLLRDFLDGVSLICVHGANRTRPVAFSVHAVIRGALEALAYLYWTAEPDIDDHTRRVRHCADLAQQMQSRHRLDEYAKQDGTEMEHDWDELLLMCQQWDVPHKQTEAGGPVQVYDAAGKRIKRPDSLKIMAPLMPSAQHLNVGAFFTYNVNDVMHASFYGALRPATVSRDGEGHLSVVFSRPKILHNAAGVFWACYRPLKVVYALLGWEVERLESVNNGHAQGLSDAMADSIGVPREPVQPIGEWAEHLADPQ